MTRLGHLPRYPQRTAIVLLDDYDYWSDVPSSSPDPSAKEPRSDLGGRVPINRAYLANIVEKLDASNVSVIGIDFDLRSPRPGDFEFSDYQPETDELIRAIRRACSHGRQVILPSVLTMTQGGLAEAPSIYDPASLDDKCVHKGYIELPKDIRRVPDAVTLVDGSQADSFALATLLAIDRVAYNRLVEEGRTDFPYSQFISDSQFRDTSQTQALFSGTEILSAQASELDAKLVTKVVFIGSDWHSLGLGQGPFIDRHASPGGELAGVLLHANYLEAALQGGIVRPFPPAAAIALDVLIVFVLSCLGMLEIHWAWKWTGVATALFLVVVFSYLFLQTFGLFLDFFFPLIFVGLHAAYEHVNEWRHAHRRSNP